MMLNAEDAVQLGIHHGHIRETGFRPVSQAASDQLTEVGWYLWVVLAYWRNKVFFIQLVPA